MQYIKSNLIQIIFMLIALCLLCYGYCKSDALLMAVSSILAMFVWFVDSIVNTKKMTDNHTSSFKHPTPQKVSVALIVEEIYSKRLFSSLDVRSSSLAFTRKKIDSLRRKDLQYLDFSKYILIFASRNKLVRNNVYCKCRSKRKGTSWCKPEP